MAKKEQLPSQGKKLKLISDVPLFDEEKNAPQEDAFNHEAVANVLHAMIESNPAPLTVGLYGGWGVGKSSIVNLLKRKCKDHLVIEFNAWRYSGDSFRRQFLIATVEGLLPPGRPERAIALEEIRKLNYAKILEEDAGMVYPEMFRALLTKEGWARLRAEIRDDWRNVRPARGGLIRTIFSGVFALAGLTLWIFGSPQMQSWGVISFLLSAGNFLAPKVDNLFVSKRREVFDAKLIFPEQFEDEFSKLITKYRKDQDGKEKKVVVIIDDLDRCDGQTIKDVLITLKNFLGRKECYFFVPMDDTSVVEAIKETNKGSNNTNFNYEQLRKYFNVFVRIPAITETDILTFAQRVAETYGVRADVALIGANGHCRDARKIKHFLNLFLVKRALLEERRSQKYIDIKDEEMEEVELELSRLAVLEYQHPRIYAKLAMNPAFFSELLRAAMETSYGSDLLNEFLGEIGEENSASLWKNEANLYEFLKLTSDVHDSHTETLLSMKVSESERALGPLALKIKAAIAGAIPEGFWADLSEEDLKTQLPEILTVLDGNMSTRDKFYRRSEHAAQLSLQLIETREIPAQAKVKVFRDAVSVIMDGRAGFEIGKHLQVILDNVKLVSLSLRDMLAQKIENTFINVSTYTADARLVLTHPNLGVLISSRVSLRDKLRDKINPWQMAEGELKVKLREDLVALCERPNTAEVFGPNFPPDPVIRFAIGELATESGGLESPITKANLTLLFHKNVSLSRFASDLSTVFSMALDPVKGAPSSIPVFIEIINRITFSLPGAGDIYSHLKEIVAGYSGNIADLWSAIVRVALWCSPTKEEIDLLAEDLAVLNTEIFDVLYSQKDDNVWGAERTSLMIQAVHSKWEKNAATIANESSRDILIYCSSLEGVVKKEEISSLFQKIISSNELPTLRLWSTGIESLFQKMESLDQQKALAQLYEMMTDPKTAPEKREWLYPILNSLLRLQADDIKRSYSDKQIKLVVSGDQGLSDFAAQRLHDIRERYGNESIDALAPSLVAQILDSDDLLNRRIALNSFSDYFGNVPILTWSKFAERLRVDMNRTDIANPAKIYMLDIGRNIRLADHDASNALARLLWDVETNYAEHEVRVAASALVGQLSEKQVIPQRPPPLSQEEETSGQ